MMKQISKIIKMAAGVLCMVSSPLWAQYQLPDPGFEDWGGPAFDGNVQPRYWNYSNVEQLGIKFNFAQRETGHSGNYAMKVQGQRLEVMGIGETSPGYIALGHPWAYVSSLSAINKATAGTYGGIAWTHRPDTMTVWIKRTGNNTADENYNIVFYSWVGRAEGYSYKAKDGSCTAVPSTYIYDGEPDIRITNDANECTTVTPGQQVAEGWIYERANYANWTKIKIPILYLNNNIPEKCNVIFSASNYPNFGATTGLYAGNTLIVDDVELIYSSRIQKLYIGGREWKGFDPNNTGIQTYSLGQGATSIPQIEARRGAGTITNVHNQTATFAGRVLSGSEISITNGTVDGTPTVITVFSEDGSSSTQYQIQFVSQQSNNPRLAGIQVDGVPISGFNPYLTNYTVQIPFGTTTTPVITVDKQEDSQNVQITQAGSLNGTATIVVTAADGSTTLTYTVHFVQQQLTDNTLQDIQVNGSSIPGFISTKTTYTIELPLGTTSAPTVTPISRYPAGQQTIQIVQNTLDVSSGTGQCKISVSAPGAPTTRTYTLNYRVTASTYSFLSDLRIDGSTIANFEYDRLTYYVNLPIGTTSLPTIAWTAGDPYQTITTDASGITGAEGTFKIQVQAASGAQSIYRIIFSLEKSSNNYLSAILIDGQLLPSFSPDQTSYSYELPIGTTTLPEITWTSDDPYQTITRLDGGINGTTRITVKAGDGSTRVYTITFSVAKASDATLRMIYLDGEPLDNFSSSVLEYSILLPQGTTTLPAITYLQHDEYQTITVRSGGVNGDYRITVRPQSGASQTYTLHFSVAVSANTSLNMIYLDGIAIPDFDPTVLTYSDTLQAGTSTLPVVTFDKAESSQRVIPEQTGNTIRLIVTAENGATATYTITFVQLKSANAFLNMIYLNGERLPGFDPEQLNYSLFVADEALVPAISVDKNIGQHVVIAHPAGYGTAQITVTPEQGGANIYQITFRSPSDTITPVIPDLSENVFLSDIQLNGQSLETFSPAVHEYTITLGADESLPVITCSKGESKQSMVVGQSRGMQSIITVLAENGTTATYTLNFVRTPHTDAALQDLKLDNVTIDDFRTDRYDYHVTLPVGLSDHKNITAVTRSPYASLTISENDTAQFVDVYAEDGTHLTYTVHYHFVPSTNALLSNVLVDGVALSGFQSNKYQYTLSLPWHATSLPEITPVLADSNALEYIIQYGNISTPTTITTLAQDSITSVTYEFHFQMPKSSNATPESIDVEGVSGYSFDPDQHEYYLTLPYGSTTTPDLYATKSEQEQEIVVTRRGICDPSEVIITAEDGTQSTYRFYYSVDIPSFENVLLQIVHSTGVIDLAANPSQTDYTVSLPHGSTSFNVLSVVKNYPEQNVIIANGGIARPTQVTVLSGFNGIPDRTYTITPEVQFDAPTALSSLTVNGVSVPDFSPQQHHYVMAVNAAPAVSATLYNSSSTLDETLTTKHWEGTVEDNLGNSETYHIWFYYPGDISFDTDFEDWYDVSNALAVVDGGVPMGWHSPIDATTTGDKGSYHPEESLDHSTDATSGTTSANLKTAYLLTSAEAMPGVLSLSPQTVTVGAYYIVGHTASTLSFGEPITFRNTPDSVALDYKALENNKVTAWHWLWKANNQTSFDYTGSYNTKNVWQTVSKKLTYAQGFVPTTLDIHICPAQSETLSDYYVGTSGAQKANRYTSSMLVDNLRFFYNSRISQLSVNGTTATRNGNNFSFTLTNPENTSTPQISIVGEVEDQAPFITWSDEANGVRTAAIRNFAEDGSYTDYTLTITRPLSAEDSVHYELTNGDLSIWPLSSHQTYSVEKNNYQYRILVTAENGAHRTFTIPRGNASNDCETFEFSDTLHAEPFIDHIEPQTIKETFLPQLSSSADLQGILINGTALAEFNALNANYTIVSDQPLAVKPIVSEGQTIAVTHALSGQEHTFSITVTSQDGVNTANYTILQQPAPVTLHSAELTGIRINGQMWQDFAPNIHQYDITLDVDYPNLIAQMPDVNYITADSLQQVEITIARQGTDHILTCNVFAADESDDAQYIIRFISHQVNQPLPVEPSHEALLSGIILNGEPLVNFLSEQMSYTITLPMKQTELPDIQLLLGHPRQRVTFARNETTWQKTVTISVTAEDGITQAEYTLLFNLTPSDITSLQMIYADGQQLANFHPDQPDYSFTLASGTTSLPILTFTKAEEMQTVTVTTDTLSTFPLSVLTRFFVTAENGISTATYTVNYTVALSTIDHLLMIYADGEPLDDFAQDVLSYHINLPVGTRSFPHLTWEQAEPHQTVAVNTLIYNDWAQTVALTVTAEDGTTSRTYTVRYDILRSSVTTLNMIWMNDEPLESFAPENYSYSILLPVGTTTLPAISWTPGDSYQTITSDTLPITNHHGQFTISVTAEDGSSATYTLLFDVELSQISSLEGIYVDGVALADFDKEIYNYSLQLPHGTTTLPMVTYTLTEDAESIRIDTLAIEGEPLPALMFTVTAEDNVHLSVYTLHFTIEPSHLADLQMIFLNGDSLSGFAPDMDAYTVALPYGQWIMPDITWTTSDDEQTVELIIVDSPEDKHAELRVTAGDQLTQTIYTLIFIEMKSDNAYLADLRLFGTTITGFHRDTMLYTCPARLENLAHATDLSATTEDPNAQLIISEMENHTLTVLVTAPDEQTTRLYVVEQPLILNSNNRLQMIYLDGVELRNFHPDTCNYTYLLPAGTLNAPEVSAVAEDEKAVVEYSAVAVEDTTRIYCTAENGDTRIYTIFFHQTESNPGQTATIQDVLFMHVDGTMTYRAISLRTGVILAIYDMDGHLIMMQSVPVVNPNDVVIDIDENGNEYIDEVMPEAQGVDFEAQPGVLYFYVFSHSTDNSRLDKGGKFMIVK
ncbi:MAG: hypothetical protein MJZ89_01060 [Paludibacteraceae bacterium]|nr:hypothetical protein [Paludibacteraceae bacterium]